MEPNFELERKLCYQLARDNEKSWQITLNPVYSIAEKRMKFQTIIQWIPSTTTSNIETTTDLTKLKQSHASRDEAFTCMINHVTVKLWEGYQIQETISQEQKVSELGKRSNQEDLDEDIYKKIQISQQEEDCEYTEENMFNREVKIYQTQGLTLKSEEEDYGFDRKSELEYVEETNIPLSTSGMSIGAESPCYLENIDEDPNEEENCESFQSENVQEEVETQKLDESLQEDELAEDSSSDNQENNVEEYYYVAELVDGIRCFWNGKILYASCGAQLMVPRTYAQFFINRPFDGVLYREQDSLTINDPIFRKAKPKVSDWEKLKFVVYDTPCGLPFRERLGELQQERQFNDSIYFTLAPYDLISASELKEYSRDLQNDGGAGFVVKCPDASYTFDQGKGFAEIHFD